MTDLVELTFADAFAPPVRCARCESDDLLAMDDGGRINFYCRGCGTCWHVEFSVATVVDPAGCSECWHGPRCDSLAHGQEVVPR